MYKHKLNIGMPFNIITVEVIQKPIKNVHLKVFRDLKVVLSVPIDVPQEWVEHFLLQKVDWISKQIAKYKQSSGYNNLTNIKSGSSTQLLGKDMRILKKESTQNFVEADEKNIVLYLMNVEDETLSQRLLEKWWRDKASTVYSQEIDYLFNKIFRKYAIEKPIIQIKKMKTLWGSCTPARNKITLNEYLLKADLRCIKYVVLHELTHLLYPYHNKDFYEFLTIQMPDWKVRKEQLDKEVVQGL
jgi:predicted metal-dependent hydrolase